MYACNDSSWGSWRPTEIVNCQEVSTTPTDASNSLDELVRICLDKIRRIAPVLFVDAVNLSGRQRVILSDALELQENFFTVSMSDKPN
jgi:hypothetical protein